MKPLGVEASAEIPGGFAFVVAPALISQQAQALRLERCIQADFDSDDPLHVPDGE